MNKLKSYLFHKLTSHYFKLPKDISIVINGDNFTMNGVEMSEKQINDLNSDAIYLRDSILLNSLLGDLKSKAEDDLLMHARTPEDMLFPKATLYVVNNLLKSIQAVYDLPLDKDNRESNIDSVGTFTIK